ncbi:signal peptide peptidase SppA [Buchnera aphidicola]|uniref:Protease 4 n=1 Tax=Buchnera aphidicola (Cinara curvipes) TaxID=2518975 RepID=A0A451D6M0_9GAMM|nr:signal peptide peptidase SppA [Buchnera aphidicola]VFP81468.1 Protease 4 [Buchnera aphidicola (Cinara curvipes)]
MNKILKFIMQIFTCINKILNIIKEIFSHTILLLMIGFIFWIAFNFKKNTYTPIPEEIKPKLLVISLNNRIEETTGFESLTEKTNYSFWNQKIQKERVTSVFEIAEKINQAKNDPNIIGLMLRIENDFSANQVVLKYMGKKINEFKESKKPVVTIGNSFSQSAYYLASFSNKIFLSKNGNIQINGITTSKLYLKKFLDLNNINMHIFRIGKYKSAVEPFLRNSPSKESKKIDQRLIRYKWKEFLQDIAYNRKILINQIYPNPDYIIKYLKNNKNNYAKYALKNNLVDHLVDGNSINKYLLDIFYKKEKNPSYEAIEINDYKINKNNISPNYNKIAIILANGVIENNSNSSSSMNVKSIIDQINIAEHDNNIKAVVLRINSPGGNIEVSEIIRKKLIELHKHKKPLVISMGETSASGGYWIATAGNYIFAHKTTITGSIGIFSIVPTLEKVLSSIGITNQIISTKHNSSYNIFNDLSSQNKKKINLEISRGYEKFIKIVAQSRNKTIKEIHEIAQGRVWLGKDAKKIGLIDQIGDIDSAVEKAAQLANVKDYNVLWLQDQNSLINLIKEKINLLKKEIFKHALYTLFSREFVNKIFVFYKNISYVINTLEFNKLMSLYLNDYQIK